ncbi:hypothetical protein E4U43_000448 [Claviceps pusilla]|uniref:Uncharacterized protein n=1 Tax=Claviceps pusilla TaxID=123648 RepID=A0A9P7NA62_9HYPO|nr:hypothetical protein E4U43_000448 [Claviceps pusilla]
MYGSYGSYSILTTMSTPLGISFNQIRSHDSSCAYPSWPRRSSLSDSDDDEPQATSYLSDDDLYFSGPFDDDNRSVSSSSSPPPPNRAATGLVVTEEEFLQRECERVTMQKEYLRQIKLEKERRRQLALRARKSSPRKSPKNKQAAAGLTTIVESTE